MVLKQSRAHLVPPDDILSSLDGRRPLIEDDLENEDDLKNKVDLKNDDDLKKEDDHKNEDELKNEDDLKNEDKANLKKMSYSRLYRAQAYMTIYILFFRNHEL